jgi:hypothetical protein
MSQKYEKLKSLLQELFQLNQPDLDFGLYRVMHAPSRRARYAHGASKSTVRSPAKGRKPSPPRSSRPRTHRRQVRSRAEAIG